MPFSEGCGPKSHEGGSVPFGLTPLKALAVPESFNAAVPVSTKPLGHQCSTMSLLHGGAMPIPRLHCCSFNEANIFAEWQRAGLRRRKAVSPTPQSVALGHGFFFATDCQLCEVPCRKLGCFQAGSACCVLSSKPLILLILLTQQLQFLHVLLRRQWLHLAQVTREELI